MKIETKYNIGDKVWVVYENQGEVCVYDTEITDIFIDKNGINYYGKEGTDYLEDLLISYNEKDKLLERILSIMNEIHEREKGADNIESSR